jgi:tetratricopeptide (TPR) repeat protein
MQSSKSDKLGNRCMIRALIELFMLPFVVSAVLALQTTLAQTSTAGTDQKDNSFQQGLLALKENRLEAALENLTAAEREHSSDARIRNFRGIVLARLGRNAEAGGEYREAIRLDPKLEDAHRNLGFLEWTEHRLDTARQELQRALELAPDDAFAHYYLGRVQLDANHYAEAFAELERSCVPWPTDADFLIQTGRGYRELGRLDDARKTAGRLLTMQLSKAQSVSAAELLISLHKNDAGIDVLRKLQPTERSRSTGWLQYDLGLAHLLSGNYASTMTHAQQFLELQTREENSKISASAWSLIGIAEARLHQPGPAIDAFRHATALAPEQEEHWLNLTRVLMAENRYAEAISATEAGLAANPKSYALHLRLGAAYLGADRYAEAERTFRQLISAGDPLPTSYIGLAQVLLRTGRADDAVTELNAAEQRLGSNFLIVYFRGLALNRAGKPAQALHAFEEAVRLNSASAEAHLGLGKTEMSLGRAADAIGELEQSLRLDPANVQAERLLSQARRRAGEKQPVVQSGETTGEVSQESQEHLVDDFFLPAWEMPPSGNP